MVFLDGSMVVHSAYTLGPWTVHGQSMNSARTVHGGPWWVHGGSMGSKVVHDGSMHRP